MENRVLVTMVVMLLASLLLTTAIFQSTSIATASYFEPDATLQQDEALNTIIAANLLP